MYTILHISDLHRTGNDSLSNTEVLSSLVSDFQRSASEDPPLARPDAIFVSGDLVEGLPIGSDQYPHGLEAQYEEALDLLSSLTQEFLGGDRTRMVLVPGNHDVDWNGAWGAFRVVEDEDAAKTDPRSLIGRPEVGFRWSWANRRLYRIVNAAKYEQRFKYFNHLYRQFYEQTDLNCSLNVDRSWNLFQLDGGRIIVGAFNSCVFNDCFSDLGYIRPPDLADCHLEMRRVGLPGCLPIAVWHHGVGGSPLASDYLESAVVKQMVDKGFRVGFHGHRHDSTVSPVDLYVSTKEEMAVIGAGSLCSGPNALPSGVNRRYNVIQLDLEEKMGIVHVREMNQPSIWGPGQLFESGGQSHVSLRWTASTLHDLADQGRSGGHAISIVDEIERLLESGKSSEAQKQLEANQDMPPGYKRRLLAKAFLQAEAWQELSTLLRYPENDDELALYVSAAERSGKPEEAAETLSTIESGDIFDAVLIGELKRRVAARITLGEGT